MLSRHLIVFYLFSYGLKTCSIRILRWVTVHGYTVLEFNQMSDQLSLAIRPWIGIMSTANGHSWEKMASSA